MEFGITIPLQRQPKIPAPFYGSERELCYCWELHGIVLQGGRALTAAGVRERLTPLEYLELDMRRLGIVK